LISDLAAVAERHDPAAWTRTLRYRERSALPFDARALRPGAALLLDATVYVDAAKGDLPRAVQSLVNARPLLQPAPALAELAIAIGHLDPRDRRTSATLAPIKDVLRRIDQARALAPTPACWVEAAVLAGILARTQGIPRSERHKLQTDALLFLMAEEAGAVLLSRNVRDFDLLLQMKPGVQVLLYERV
jgi:hypothetical protein